MRTTLDIEPDILAAAREIAAKEKSTAGRVISRLARQGMLGRGERLDKHLAVLRNGVPVIPATGHPITLDHVRKLMDEEGL
jgi:hypothetical protein